MLAKIPGLLTKVDGVQLARYCVMLPLWWKLQAVVAKFSTGEMLAESLENESSQAIIKVALKEARETHAELKRIEGSFGMTPSDRSRISIPGDEQSGVIASEARKRSG
jgi:phage terminase small subunit